MNTIINEKEKTIIVKKSKFIGIIREIDSKEEASSIISFYKDKYRDSTHVCYAYILDNTRKMSDDGEPSGTAGIPMLELLKKKNLNRVIGIVIRYFGGVKLGANGLIHAYVDALNNTLENNVIETIKGYNIIFNFEYPLVNDIDYIIRECTINNKSFDEFITYDIDCNDNIYNILKTKNINIISIKNKYIKQK